MFGTKINGSIPGYGDVNKRVLFFVLGNLTLVKQGGRDGLAERPGSRGLTQGLGASWPAGREGRPSSRWPASGERRKERSAIWSKAMRRREEVKEVSEKALGVRCEREMIERGEKKETP